MKTEPENKTTSNRRDFIKPAPLPPLHS